MVFPIVLTPLIWIYGRHRRRLTGDEAYARSFRARTESLHRLRKAVELQKSGHFDQSVDALASAVTQYMADRLNLPAASLSLRQIEQCLSQEKKVHVDIEELQKLWISIETLRFAPVAPTSDAVESLISESRRLLEKYENLKFPKRKSRAGADR